MVIDASIVIKWFLLERDSAVALAALEAEVLFLAPAHVFGEVGEVLVRAYRRKRIAAEQIHLAVASLGSSLVPLAVDDLISTALDIAMAAPVSVYDTLYVAAAEREDAMLLTADRKFAGALGATSWRDRVMLLQDWAPGAARS